MHTHPLQPHEAHRYLTGGKGEFTIVGQQTRYTYKVSQTKDDNGNLSPLFIKLLVAPDQYQYIGYIGLDNLLQLQAGKKGQPRHPAFIALAWWLNAYRTGNQNLAKAEFWHEGTCCRCGRTLTVPESIKKGIGPVCEEMQNENLRQRP